MISSQSPTLLTIESKHKVFRRLAVVAVILLVAQLLFWFWDDFGNVNYRIYDNLFRSRLYFSPLNPVYNNQVVHIDLDDTSIRVFQDYTPDRSTHARVIENLSAMGVSSQLHDFIFAGRTEPAHDGQLVEAAREAGDCYIGLAFSLSTTASSEGRVYGTHNTDRLPGIEWVIEDDKTAVGIPVGGSAILSYEELSAAAKGNGFLNIIPDAGGVFRKTPLLIRVKEGLYPSLALRLVCDVLGVLPANIKVNVVRSGLLLHLENAVFPGREEPETVIIPLDKEGNLRLNFIGPWESMSHYHFSDIWQASDDIEELELWKEELAGKIAVVSQTTTGSADIGAVPTDAHYPLSGIHSTVIHTILSRDFIRERGSVFTIPAQLGIVLILALFSLHRSTSVFMFSAGGVTFFLGLLGSWLFMAHNMMVQLFFLIVVCLTTVFCLQLLRAFEDARAVQASEMKKKLVERELEIGREIQAGFFPEMLPVVTGWDIDAFFRPARQVAGDFYDIFPLQDNRFTAVVLADVCDKGVGAALFMALSRSLLRATALEHAGSWGNEAAGRPEIGKLIQRSVSLTSDYIAVNHTKSGMFATVFMAVLDSTENTLYYSNCGHEPPVVFSQDGGEDTLKPTGPAIGLFPDMEFGVKSVLLERGDVLFAYTDGLTDAQDPEGGLFKKERLLEIAFENRSSAQNVIQAIMDGVDSHIALTEQYDDITMVVLRRDLSNRKETGQQESGVVSAGG